MNRTVQFYDSELASKMKPGEKYRPSNGSEGEAFMESWCAYCVRDKEWNGTLPAGKEATDEDWCEIIGRTFAHDVSEPEYPIEWQYGEDGQPKCTAFVPLDCRPRCERTIEMFPDQDRNISG